MQCSAVQCQCSAKKVSYGTGKVSHGAGKVSHGAIKVSHGAGKVSTDYCLLSENFELQESAITSKKGFETAGSWCTNEK